MKLFVRIFLCFWAATILMIAAVLTASNRITFVTRQDRKTSFAPDIASIELSKAINIFEQQGASAFLAEIDSVPAIQHSSLCLTDTDGKVLLRTGTEWADDNDMAEHAMSEGHSELVRFGFRTAFATPVYSGSGRRYAIVMTITAHRQVASNPRFWFDISIALLPTSLVCMLLALYLTRPITRLRRSAQLLASGDLSARASKGRNWRRDELGDLARDFDVMAAQIQLLMTAQRRFVADVSHELGAPLTRLHLALALSRRENAGQTTVALARIERETDKLSNLVQQLLLLAGLEAGSWPAETLTTVSLEVLCADIVEDADFEAVHANCRVTGTREEIALLVYPSLLRRAIDNILRNAIRYAPANTEVSLDCRVNAAQDEVIIEVCDSGPGVPESMLSDIFQPFFRTDPGRTSKSGGTGLGLAIASEAIRLHDGTIEASNRPEGGLKVTIKLPLRVPADEEYLTAGLNLIGEEPLG